MMHLTRVFVLGLAALLAVPSYAAPAPELQPWQTRERGFLATAQAAGQGKPEAVKAYDAILTEFETSHMTRTPMENMDILGVFYVRREGFAKALPIVAMNAVLGWYDTLRYDGPDGRKAVANKQRFFFRALDLAGKQRTQEALQFLQDHREESFRLINQGIGWAERYKDQDTYDHRWPTAFEAPGSPTSLPPEKWGAAWEDAKAQVRNFYVVPAKLSRPLPLQYMADVRRQSLASDTLFQDMIAAPGGVGTADLAFYPRAQTRKLIKIQVVVPYVHEQPGREVWTVEHAPGEQVDYEVQFQPDGHGGTNFGVNKKP